MGSILKVIEHQHRKSMKNHWYESYWMVDFHGVISIPNYEIQEMHIDFPDGAEEALRLLSNRIDIRLILYTSSYPDQVKKYLKLLEDLDITFDYINENPEIRSYEDFGYYDTKPYFDVFLDDKAGFDPEEWPDILKFLQTCDIPDKEWINSRRRRMSSAELSTERREQATQKVLTNVSEQLS